MAFNVYMHERNIYRNPPDFTQIALDFPEFQKYTIPDAKGQKVRVDFTNPDALRMVTKILLKKDFNLDVEIPEGFLIPTIPQRLNYILWLEDLLCNIPKKKECISGIDIGTGPCAIFSLLGAQKNGWKFIATESSVDAILWAEKNINKNNLIKNISVVKVNEGSTLNEVLSADNETYDFCLCNPPFFENIEEIRQKHRNTNETIADTAQKGEIFVKGGELNFVKNILKDSLIYKNRISLFTSMFGKKKSLLQIVKEIQEIKDAKFTTTEFCQGNTVRWGIAWTFNESIHFEKQVKKKNKPKKTKPPLEYQIPLTKSKNFTFESVIKEIKVFLKFLQIPITEKRASKHFVELLLKSNKNTWSHQRRKRRELEREKKRVVNVEEKQALAETDSISSKNFNSAQNLPLSVAENVSSENSALCLKDDHEFKSIHFCSKSVGNEALVNVENDQTSDVLDSIPSKNVNFSNKRKGDFISEDLCINKKAHLDENFTSCHINDSPNTQSENLNLKDSQNTDSMSIKTDIFINMNETNTEKAYIEKNKVNVLPIISSESHSKDVCPFQNCPSSLNCEKLCSLEKDNELLSSKECFNTSTKNIGSPSVPEQDLILYCHLQAIKGKSKIYVKMNCPDTADRNTMHQVFQLIKNKVH